tara:strand:- start:20 stop:274 length:255 start_codon:yes stop_codon:yes gene_type:complete
MKPLILKKEWEVKTIPNIHEWTHKDTLQVINDGIVKNIPNYSKENGCSAKITGTGSMDNGSKFFISFELNSINYLVTIKESKNG